MVQKLVQGMGLGMVWQFLGCYEQSQIGIVQAVGYIETMSATENHG